MASTELKRWAVQECRGWSGGKLKLLCRLIELLRRGGWHVTGTWEGTVYLRDEDRRRLRLSMYEPQRMEPVVAQLSVVVNGGGHSARTIVTEIESRCLRRF